MCRLHLSPAVGGHGVASTFDCHECCCPECRWRVSEPHLLFFCACPRGLQGHEVPVSPLEELHAVFPTGHLLHCHSSTCLHLILCFQFLFFLCPFLPEASAQWQSGGKERESGGGTAPEHRWAGPGPGRQAAVLAHPLSPHKHFGEPVIQEQGESRGARQLQPCRPAVSV